MNILLVDDDPEIQFLTKFVLEQTGEFDVTGVESIDKAKVMLTEMVFEGILLDVMLPDGSGIDMYEEIQDNPEIDVPPVVFLTGKDAGEIFQKIRSLGAAGFIQKPFNPANLAEQVRSILRPD
ncbi:MAG: response regulator [Candidatus Marinimicrobia bacterium]|nr:response regulator [Candidatus Neomarinimicrobiota bacterium]MCF7829727.1 response regulator [Candidatus Neomarinimicrobiota bacterium]MCF7881677.1 response regulator [Candidatus Neomarinimicrobiota bacterium]